MKQKTKKILRPTAKEWKSACDELNRIIVWARAANMSELSYREGMLHPHHLFGKKSLKLRYFLDGEICLTPDEHVYGIHSDDIRRQQEVYAAIKRVRDLEHLESLIPLLPDESWPDIFARLWEEYSRWVFEDAIARPAKIPRRVMAWYEAHL